MTCAYACADVAGEQRLNCLSNVVDPSTQGMKLGAPSKASSMLDSLVQEDNINIAAPPPSSTRGGGTAQVPAPVVQNQPIQLVIEEKVRPLLSDCSVYDGFVCT